MNAAVHEAIAGLQQSMTALQAALLGNDLIQPNAVIRTIRASSTLEDAQQAWSRFLNLPGRVSSPGGGLSGPDDSIVPSLAKKAVGSMKISPSDGKHYTHKELWGREDTAAEEVTPDESRRYGVVVTSKEQSIRGGRDPRSWRSFVA